MSFIFNWLCKGFSSVLQLLGKVPSMCDNLSIEYVMSTNLVAHTVSDRPEESYSNMIPLQP